MKQAPITAAERAMLLRDAKDVVATAKRKGLTMSQSEAATEQFYATHAFEMGCWLFHYAKVIGREKGFWNRLGCIRLIVENGFNRLGDEFFTCFNFGSRQFDTLFEMGDAKQLILALSTLAAGREEYRAFFRYHKWPLPGEPVTEAQRKLAGEAA